MDLHEEGLGVAVQSILLGGASRLSLAMILARSQSRQARRSTSYGYFDDDGNRCALTEMARALRPGGKLLIGHQNRDFVLRTYLDMLQPPADEPAPVRFVHEKEDAFLIDTITHDSRTDVLVTDRVIMRGGTPRRLRYAFRLFTFAELRTWLAEAGFSAITAFGDHGGDFSLRSRKMYVVATRDGGNEAA